MGSRNLTIVAGVFAFIVSALVVVSDGGAARPAGGLFSGTVAGSGAQNTTTYQSAPAAKTLAVFVNASRAGKVQAWRVDSFGVPHAQSSTSSAVAVGKETVLTFTYPVRKVFVRYTNSATLSATLQVEVDDGVPR